MDIAINCIVMDNKKFVCVQYVCICFFLHVFDPLVTSSDAEYTALQLTVERKKLKCTLE